MDGQAPQGPTAVCVLPEEAWPQEPVRWSAYRATARHAVSMKNQRCVPMHTEWTTFCTRRCCCTP